MRVQDKLLILFFGLVVSFNALSDKVLADNLSDGIQAYNSGEYRDSINYLKDELENNPNNAEAYKWLAKSYEAIFDIEKSMDAYKNYENLRKSINSNSTPQPTQTILPIPTATPTATSTPRTFSTPKPTPTPKHVVPTVVSTKKPKPLPTPKPTLAPVYDGWSSISIMEVKSEKVLKIIPRNSADLSEVEEKSGKEKKFILIRCKIRYNKDIIIKTNSNEITLTDNKNQIHRIYAMSTYKFQYGGNIASKKTEALQVGDYFQLSKKDSRDSILLLFKIDESASPEELKVLGYKNIPITNFKG